jgi:Tol biopolymer transport system component
VLALPLVVSADIGLASEYHVDIVAVGVTGKQANLTQSASFNASPAPAVDNRIAFVSDRDWPPDLYVMDADGRNVRRLTTNAGVVGGAEDLEVSRAAWSPAADGIAFDGEYGPVEPNCLQHCFGWAVSIVGSDGSDLRQIALNARRPAWSPDGRRIAYLSGVGVTGYESEASSVTITRLDGSGSRVVQALNHDADNAGPVWSPSGDELAFQTGGADAGRRSIYVIRADGRGKRRLTTGHDPTWSPNGRHLAFVSAYRLATVDLNGKNKRRLSRKSDYVVTAAWSPSSSTIAYIAGTSPTGYGGLAKHLRLKLVGADGKHVRVLAHEPDDVLVWGPPVWTRDGKRILLAR